MNDFSSHPSRSDFRFSGLAPLAFRLVPLASRLLTPHLSLAEDDKFGSGQFGKPHRTEGVQLGGTDADFSPRPN